MDQKLQKPTSIDIYISQYPEHVRMLLEEIRTLIHQGAPAATETISYGIPTFKLHGNLVHFAGYKGHIGFYPGSAAIEAFKNEISKYKWAKGSVQFPINEKLPVDLIKRMVQFCVVRKLAKVKQ